MKYQVLAHRATTDKTTYINFIIITIAFLLVHVSLFVFDVHDPEAILRGDRAGVRLHHITQLMQDADANWKLLHGAAPGDYLIHFLLYRISGPYLIIFAQILAEYIMLLFYYYVLARLVNQRSIALAASLVVVIMPGFLMNSHLLVTEAWSTSLLTMGILISCLSAVAISGNKALFLFVTGLICISLAAFVRPQYMLTIFALAALHAATGRLKASHVIGAAVAALAIYPVAFVVLHWHSTGLIELGASDADLGTNLANRVRRISAAGGADAGFGEKVDISTFLSFAIAHPLGVAKTYINDAINIMLNPGANHVFVNYMSLFGKGDDWNSWSNTLDQKGVLAVLAQIIAKDWMFVAVLALYGALQLFMVAGLCLAVWRVATGSPPIWFGIIVTVIVLNIAVAFSASPVRWSQRSGLEPLMAAAAILAFWPRAMRAHTMSANAMNESSKRKHAILEDI